MTMTPMETAGAALVVAVAASFYRAGAKPLDFVQFNNKSDYIFLSVMFMHMLKTANDAPTRKLVSSVYWPIGVISCGIAAFGGGFLAPLTVGRCPAPLLEETMIWTCIASWYFTYQMGWISETWAKLAATWPVRNMLLAIFAIFRTHQVIGCIEIASAAALAETIGPRPRFIYVPYASMLVCGFIGGCGGSFLPFDKGFTPLQQGRNFPVTFALFSTLYYIGATRMLGVDKMDAKMYIALVRLLCELFPGPREQALGVVRSTYKVVGLPDACMDGKDELPQ